MASLYSAGWRQGSVFAATLPLDSVVFGDRGLPSRQQAEHGLWVVATQNCDLASADTGSTEPVIELRPVYTADPPDDWGIRSSQLLLAETEYVEAQSPRLSVTPAVLTALLAAKSERRDPSEDRALAFTTWLGRRYDRPAVPGELIPLAKRSASEVKRHRHRLTAQRVRDVLMQIDGSVTAVALSHTALLRDSPLVVRRDHDRAAAWRYHPPQCKPARTVP